MKLSDFDFELPERLIAVRPAKPRSSARLLVARGDQIADSTVADLGDVLRSGDVLVLNDTKVIPARLFGLRHRNGEPGRHHRLTGLEHASGYRLRRHGAIAPSEREPWRDHDLQR